MKGQQTLSWYGFKASSIGSMIQLRILEGEKMTRYWVAFDLGLQGDYDSLYGWLDQQRAVECGDSVATFKSKKTRDQIAAELKLLLDENKKPRIYLVSKSGGKFLMGKRKRSPWTGYAEVAVGGGEDV
jgi:hypothetical protein